MNMKFIRIFLLILIIIGIGLLITQKMWVPKLVDIILETDNREQQISVISDVQNKSTNKISKTKQVSHPLGKIYKNSVYGYSFEYPTDYTIQDSGKHDFQYVTNLSNPYGDVSHNYLNIEIRENESYENYGDSEESFLKVANSGVGMQAFCQADAPGISIHLTDVFKQNKYSNKHNITYYESFFRLEEGDRDLGIAGPFYAFRIFSGNARAIYIYSSDVCESTSSPASPSPILDNLVQSFSF